MGSFAGSLGPGSTEEEVEVPSEGLQGTRGLGDPPAPLPLVFSPMLRARLWRAPPPGWGGHLYFPSGALPSLCLRVNLRTHVHLSSPVLKSLDVEVLFSTLRACCRAATVASVRLCGAKNRPGRGYIQPANLGGLTSISVTCSLRKALTRGLTCHQRLHYGQDTAVRWEVPLLPAPGEACPRRPWNCLRVRGSSVWL